MFKRKGFWLAQYAVVIALWLAALVLISTGRGDRLLVRLAEVVLVAHVLELPLAFRALRGWDVTPTRTALLTLLFGYTWWMPASRGVFASK